MNTVRLSLAWKILVYYGIYLALLMLLGQKHPFWIEFMPVGGLQPLQDGMLLDEGEGLLERLLTPQAPISLFHDAISLFSALFFALLVMIPIRWVYLDDDLNPAPNAGVAIGLLLLPMVVAAIIFVVKFSLPLAFALTGIFAGLRHQTRLKQQLDAYFTFAAIAVGLAAGTRTIGIGVVLAIFFASTVLFSAPRTKPNPEIQQ
jgi:hypothetical protein